jgi:hypothetical protein
MAAFRPLSAKNAKVRISTFVGTTETINVYTAKKWSVNPTADELDTTNFEGDGFGDRIAGILDAEFTVDADWDSNNNNYLDPPDIVPGAEIFNVKLFLDGDEPISMTTDPRFWFFPSALVLSVPSNAEVRGLLTISFTAKNKGIYYPPGYATIASNGTVTVGSSIADEED